MQPFLPNSHEQGGMSSPPVMKIWPSLCYSVWVRQGKGPSFQLGGLFVPETQHGPGFSARTPECSVFLRKDVR